MCKPFVVMVILGLCLVGVAAGDDRPRIIATTDGEIDDRCSMVRFLMYAGEWDIEGIIYSASKFHWKGHNWAGETWIEEQIDAYAKVWPNLKQHDPAYPPPDDLRKVVYVGNISKVGAMAKDTPGSDRIVEVLLDDEPGPVYLQAWGGTNTIARALWKIEHDHPDAKQKVSRKAIIYIILDQDKTFRKYIQPNWPGITVLGSFRQFAAIAYKWNQLIPESHHRWFDKAWMQANIVKGHGPLGAAYPVDFFKSEGDSPSFMHQIRVGLGSLADPSFGGWGGRFVREKPGSNTWRGAKDDGDLSKPIWRWAEHFQNDWAARADWCVKPPGQANHPPRPVVNGSAGLEVIRVKAKPGQTVRLSAEGTRDPDGDGLSYEWWHYKDVGSYGKAVAIPDATGRDVAVPMPQDAGGHALHIILTVRDDGEPNLFAYRRVMVDVTR